jgi:hypothetical protein
MTPPPKKTRWGMIAASLAAAIGLAVAGAYAYDHFFDRESHTSNAAGGDSSTAPTTRETRDSAAPSETVAVPPAGGRAEAPTGASPRGAPSSAALDYQYPGGRSEQYRLLAVLLNESSLHTVDPGGTIQQAKMVCESLGRGDDFATAANSTVARDDADGAVVRTVSGVVSVQMFCPQYSPVGDSRGAVMTPNNPDQDGEMFNRLQGVGIRISDLPNVSSTGRQVCSTLAGDPNNYPAAYAMVENSGLGLDRLSAQFFTVIAHQAYCPSK